MKGKTLTMIQRKSMHVNAEKVRHLLRTDRQCNETVRSHLTQFLQMKNEGFCEDCFQNFE